MCVCACVGAPGALLGRVLDTSVYVTSGSICHAVRRGKNVNIRPAQHLIIKKVT